MSDHLVDAIWRGPSDGELFGRLIRRGEHALVTERDLLSAYWERVKPLKPAPAPAQATNTTDDRSDS